MSDTDPLTWLEEVDGERALGWVAAENARSLAVLEADPRYAGLHEAALAIVTAQDRIPYPRFLGAGVANFWQDETQVRGRWRRTTVEGFAAASPDWETLIDIDALAAAEGRNFVYQGAIALPPDDRRALVALSDGGKDANEWREFDLETKAFVENGFCLPEGKQSVAWVDADTVLVARDWGPGTLTRSGYPFILKRWRRGEPLDRAEEVFRGTAEDVSVHAAVLRDGDGAVRGIGVARALNFFESERCLLTGRGPVRLKLPRKANFQGFVAGQLVFTLQEEWAVRPGVTVPVGALISLDLDACLAEAPPDPVVIHAPGPREAIEAVAATRARLVATIYRSVRAAAVAYRRDGGRWTAAPLALPDNALPDNALPDNASIAIAAVNDRDDRAFFDVAGFLSPSTLYLADLAGGAPAPVKAAPARFDASGAVVEQFEAVSADGTRVPYFVIRPRDLAFDGAAPTLLYGYGGFAVALTPNYAAIAGKLWIERGGVYVVANIRGGGEFGPNWHQAALKQKRQRAYDDFIAVAEDLVARRITSSRRLGIMGGSNGGLLMGVMLTQRPDLFRAVVIQVPLLDMLRFHKLLAGASWIAEYGDPEIAEEAEFLRRISPYHNLVAGRAYPEPLFVTSTRDDRVHPGHARKMAAKMAAMGLPFLYYENVEGGHSAAANLRQRAHHYALEFTYLARKLMD